MIGEDHISLLCSEAVLFLNGSINISPLCSEDRICFFRGFRDTALVLLPEFWHFLTFCHCNFFFEPVFIEFELGTRFVLPVIAARLTGNALGTAAIAIWERQGG